MIKNKYIIMKKSLWITLKEEARKLIIINIKKKKIIMKKKINLLIVQKI